MFSSRFVIPVLAFAFLLPEVHAQRDGLLWPATGEPVVKVQFGPFQRVTSARRQQHYTVEATSENVASSTIRHLTLHVRLLDRNNVRIGETMFSLRDVEPGQVVKSVLHVTTVGTPVTAEITSDVRPDQVFGSPMGKLVPLRVESVPSGAQLKVNGEKAGVTPRIVRLPPGNYTLEWSKEGFRTATHVVDVTADELPGSAISVELGGLMQDTVQLRDGRVLLGDVDSVTLTNVEVRVEGKLLNFSRNEVRKIILVEREIRVE